jgi:shikimate kinase
MNVRAPIVIIGFMACGKTEVARVVAKQLNLKMIDLDEEITSSERRSPAELIREEERRTLETSKPQVCAECSSETSQCHSARRRRLDPTGKSPTTCSKELNYCLAGYAI